MLNKLAKKTFDPDTSEKDLSMEEPSDKKYYEE